MKKKKTFRFEEETVSELERYAEARNISQTEAMEEAIRLAIRETDGGETRKSGDLAFSALVAQLEAKDAQISALSQALTAAQETAKAAQMLHAADKPELLPERAQEGADEVARRLTWRERLTGRASA